MKGRMNGWEVVVTTPEDETYRLYTSIGVRGANVPVDVHRDGDTWTVSTEEGDSIPVKSAEKIS